MDYVISKTYTKLSIDLLLTNINMEILLESLILVEYMWQRGYNIQDNPPLLKQLSSDVDNEQGDSI